MTGREQTRRDAEKLIAANENVVFDERGYDELRFASACLALLAELEQAEERAKTGCEFGCGPEPDDGSHVGGPGVGIIPACPVHGWVCALLDARDARVEQAEREQGRRLAITPREVERLWRFCRSESLDLDLEFGVYRGPTGTLNTSGDVVHVQVSGADDRFEAKP